MTGRVIGSYYRAGVDEMQLEFEDAESIARVYDYLSRDILMGIEVINQTSNNCVLRYLAGELEEFDQVLRRTFLLLINMGEETIRVLKDGEISLIKNVGMPMSRNRVTVLGASLV